MYYFYGNHSFTFSNLSFQATAALFLQKRLLLCLAPFMSVFRSAYAVMPAVLLSTLCFGAVRFALADPAPTALPTCFFAASGQVTTPHTAGNDMVISQQSVHATIDWTSFDIGRDASVTFYQPQNGIAVNRVNNQSGDPTQIYGALRANGTVFVLDTNGVIFGRDAKVDVGSIIAATGTLTRFDAGGYTLENIDANPQARIENHGVITVADGGLAAFVAPHVQNNNIIQARLGTAALASGKTVTLDLHGDGLWSVAAPAGLSNSSINNTGIIQADGGQVYLTVKAAQQTANAVINNTGVISAQRFAQRDGKIILQTGTAAKTFTNTVKIGKNADVQKALDTAAADGSSTFQLAAGDYDAPLVIRTGMTLQGDLSDTSRISSPDDTPAITVSADNVTLQYLHIFGAVFAEGVRNLHITGNALTYHGAAALHLIRSQGAVITWNTFMRSGEGSAVLLQNTQKTHMADNMYLGSAERGVESHNDNQLHFEDSNFFGAYTAWLHRIVSAASSGIDDRRLRNAVVSSAAPPATTVDITISNTTAAAADIAALAAMSPAAGGDDDCADSANCP